MNIQNHPVVSREEWVAARKQHLAHEKAFTKERDKLSAERRALPWVKIDKPYRFQGTNGELSLTDLFGGRSQLIVYHFMFAAGWDEGCPGCSFLSDHIDGANQHLAHHDVAVVAVSHAPFAEFQPFKQRMGWQFDWVSSEGCDFNYDFGVCARAEDVATGKATYNYEKLTALRKNSQGLACFIAMKRGRFFTPIQRMREAWICWSVPTTTST
ncbi:DUF899 family protein [Pseudomonas sp. FP1740]|nr:DUF899 family protein [Pseudomonas sp. FP1740]WLG46442.1 DUF899 family protein [Pseudomonas sp. FP1740]